VARRAPQVHVLDYDQESNSIRAQLYGHKHEVWHLAPSPSNASLLASVYCDGTGALSSRGGDASPAQHRAAAWRR
jgi:hypothetical protein